MNDYPVTLAEFKLYFLREAGLEYQPYETWAENKVYSFEDKVVAIVNFKPGVWESTSDNNTSIPGEGDWEEVEEEDLDDCILDVDIERAMGEALFKFNKRLFTEPKGKIIFLYLSMFFLVYDKQMARSGLNGSSTAGPVIHRTVGKMSVSYMESKLYESNPSYEFLSSNEYGKKAFNLMAPYLRGGVMVFQGGSTGE